MLLQMIPVYSIYCFYLAYNHIVRNDEHKAEALHTLIYENLVGCFSEKVNYQINSDKTAAMLWYFYLFCFT